MKNVSLKPTPLTHKLSEQSMLEQFLKHIDLNSLGRKEKKILVTVSGGIDSIAMLKLYDAAGYSFSIAHCNFQLRGEESDGDEKFVRKLAKEYGVEIFVERFNTSEFCLQKKISVQMGARELRYTWFSKLATENSFDYIAVAHNKNDIAETMLLNLIRGTGLKGLTGIKPKAGNIIRPLLFASRKEIDKYVLEKSLVFREDSSNKETKYFRNLIRAEIIPCMEKINPSLLNTMIKESEVFNSSYQLYQKEIDALQKAIIVTEGSSVRLSILKLKSLRITAPVLYDLLRPYKFSLSDIEDILAGLNSESGRKFHSEKFSLIKDRNFLIIEDENELKEKGEYFIEEGISTISNPIKLSIKQVKNSPDFTIPRSNKTIAIDYDKLSFPLILRHWREGDYFVPLGMNGRKKLSDYFIDQKVNILDKKKFWLVISGNDIVWIVGKQIDERYKVGPQTQNILKLSLND